MLLGGIFFIALCANIWFGWMLGSWIGIIAIFAALLVIIFFAISGGIANGLVGMLFGKHDGASAWKRFFGSFLRGWAWASVILWILPLGILSVLHGYNELFPATLPRITISNGEKTVIFQSMIHIASKGFYDEVKKDMEQLREKDYVFFFEGVRPGTEENNEELGKLLGINLDKDMYLLFANITGLVLQDVETFLHILPSTNVDTSTDEIMILAKQNNITPNTTGEEQKKLIAFIEKSYPTLQKNQKTLMKIFGRGMLNALLRNYTKPSLATSLKSNFPIFTIILDVRNTLLADAITNSPNQHIYIHYGALHYPGTLAELQKRDPRWKEVTRTEIKVIQ